MGVDQDGRRWRARIRDLGGEVLGAGTMLDNEHVLTCAHVISEDDIQRPDIQVRVELEIHGECVGGLARVAENFWVPVGENDGGDIAVLQLLEPLPEAQTAPLQRMPLRPHQSVRIFGYPEGAATGLWTYALLAGGGGPGGEWIQLNTAAGSEPISTGFSGAGVIDDDTGAVVGMVVSRLVGQEAVVGWMIPVETMVGYLGRLDSWVDGDPGVDASFSHFTSGPENVPFVRELAGWLAHDPTGQVRLIVTGGADSAASAALRLAVMLADRERPRADDRLLTGVPADAVPPQGSVDLAVDASDKTADEVRHRIANRLGIVAGGARDLIERARDRLPVRTLVVDGIDDAAEPETLVSDVVLPLIQRAAELGIRLVLGFRRETSPGLTTVRSTIVDGIPVRLDRIQAWLAELELLEAGNAEQHAHLLSRLTEVPAVPVQAPFLRSALAQLRAGEADWVARKIDGCETAVIGALDAARRLHAEFDQLLRRRAELRARLELYRDRAATHGLESDSTLRQGYQAAWQQLWDGRCDLAAAGRSVEEFGSDVRHGISRLGAV